MMRTLGVATPTKDQSVGVRLGASQVAHQISPEATLRLRDFVRLCSQVVQAPRGPSSHAGLGLREQDASYDTTLAELAATGCLGPSGGYVRGLLRRKRLAMLLQDAPNEAVDAFWQTTTMAALRNIVLDMKAALSIFPESAMATELSDFFSLDSVLGPLSVSMHACLWRPVVKLLADEESDPKTPRIHDLQATLNQYRARQADDGALWVCDPSPEILFKRHLGGGQGPAPTRPRSTPPRSATSTSDKSSEKKLQKPRRAAPADEKPRPKRRREKGPEAPGTEAGAAFQAGPAKARATTPSRKRVRGTT